MSVIHTDKVQVIAKKLMSKSMESDPIDYTMKDITSFFNVHYSTVSRAIKKAESVNA